MCEPNSEKVGMSLVINY